MTTTIQAQYEQEVQELNEKIEQLKNTINVLICERDELKSQLKKISEGSHL